MRCDISIIIPVYNEAESLIKLFEEICPVLTAINKKGEIVFVDDGSTDTSYEVMRALYHDSTHVMVVRLRKNFGKSYALAAGFSHMHGDIAVTLDADLQDDPAEIPRLLAALEQGYDLVSGWKRERKDHLTKRLGSRLFNVVVRMSTGLLLHDINCGLKAYRKNVVDSLYLSGEMHRFIPVLAAQHGFRVSEIPVNHRPRRYGRSKYGIGRVPHGILDLLTVIVLTRYFSRPAHFFGTIGFLLFSIGVTADAYVAVLKFVTGSTQGKIPLLLFGILMITVGVQLISVGLLGEMIARMNESDTPRRIASVLDHSDEHSR